MNPRCCYGYGPPRNRRCGRKATHVLPGSTVYSCSQHARSYDARITVPKPAPNTVRG